MRDKAPARHPGYKEAVCAGGQSIEIVGTQGRQQPLGTPSI